MMQLTEQKCAADRWMDEQIFEEDIRAVLTMMRPNRRKRMLGWSEYRAGGEHFRATISWDDAFEDSDPRRALRVPNLPDVLETLLLGSIRSDAELNTTQEYTQYRAVLLELMRRVDEAEACQKSI